MLSPRHCHTFKGYQPVTTTLSTGALQVACFIMGMLVPSIVIGVFLSSLLYSRASCPSTPASPCICIPALPLGHLGQRISEPLCSLYNLCLLMVFPAVHEQIRIPRKRGLSRSSLRNGRCRDTHHYGQAYGRDSLGRFPLLPAGICSL